MKTHEVIGLASKHLTGLAGHVFDVIDVGKPVSVASACNIAKIISKLSPIVGNLIEFNTCDYLNANNAFNGFGVWKRQDPGFPDTVFEGAVTPTPGFEIKAWFPLATEMTGRFKDSQNAFVNDNTYVAVVAWLPEYLLFGKPLIIDITVESALSIAKSRDTAYYDPPNYLVVEPNDTTARTRNLQQTNTAGYVFQGSARDLVDATALVATWPEAARRYSPTADYQAERVRFLMERFGYRLDTNFAKMDRVFHPGLKAFKQRVLNTEFHGRTISSWSKLFAREDFEEIGRELAATFGIADAAELVE